MDEHSQPSNKHSHSIPRIGLWRTKAEICAELDISSTTCKRWVRKGKLERRDVPGGHNLYRLMSPSEEGATRGQKLGATGGHKGPVAPQRATQGPGARGHLGATSKHEPRRHGLDEGARGQSGPPEGHLGARGQGPSRGHAGPLDDLSAQGVLVAHLSRLTAQIAAQAEELGKLRATHRQTQDELAQAQADVEAALAWGSDLMTELINMECDLKAACSEGAQMLTELKARGARF